MFKLLRYFSIASLASIVVAAIALGAVYRHVAIGNLLETGERSNVALATALANTLRPQYMALVGASDLRDGARQEALHAAVRSGVAGLSVLKVKVYDLSGRTVYSSDPRQIGEDKSRNAGFLAARGGNAASELTHRGSFSAFEQTLEDLDVLSSYVPVYQGGAVEAVFEIYDDVTPLLRGVVRTQAQVVAALVAVLGALYGALFLIVRRADRILREQDATRRRNEEELRRSEGRIRMITDNVPALIGYVDTEQRFRFVNRAYEEWYGLAARDVPGKLMKELLSESAYALSKPHAEAVLRGDRAIFEQPHAIDGRNLFLQTTFVPDLDAAGNVAGFYILASDITERKRAEERLASLALQDTLTGLANRRQLVERLAQEMAPARRHGDGMAVLFLDLDGFKQVNDTLGHDVGDLLLKEVAARLGAAVRDSDLVARLGGDEFVVALSRVDDAGDAAQVAAKLVDVVCRPYDLAGHAVRVTTSIGVAVFPENGRVPDDLLKSADLALYEAKRAGKNAWRLARGTAPRASAAAAPVEA